MILRKAVLSDHLSLLEFEQAIITAERPFDDTLKADPISYYDLAELLISPNATVVVAEDNGRLVASGYAVIRTSQPYVKHDRHAYLGFMYVVPEYRGQGLNGRVVEELIKWARKRYITELKLDVYSENAPAVRSYEKKGFTKNLVEMRLGID